MPNDPFAEEGKLIPIYDGSSWSYRIEKFAPAQVKDQCFPQEDYRLEEMGEKFHGIAAYADGVCAGYAILYEEWNQWLYLDNLLVSGKYRGNGVGSAMIASAMELAGQLGKRGLWLICQDNNLQALRFYFRNGFVLGGMNLPVYEGTGQEGKADLYLYKRNGSDSRGPA